MLKKWTLEECVSGSQLVRTSEKNEPRKRTRERERDWAGVRIFFWASSAALSPVLAHFSCHPVVFGSFRLNEGLGKASL